VYFVKLTSENGTKSFKLIKNWFCKKLK
jgi:hypothetical protein